jgi:molybdopterin-guanine dinucleotide biosynthesis protein A
MSEPRVSDPRPRSDLTAIVLAGGRASRFGSDKLAVDVEGRTVLDRAIDAVADIAVDVIVVGAAASRSAVRTVDDPERFGGPLQALAAGLDATSTPLALVVAGDMPTQVPEVLAMLAEGLAAAPGIEAAVLRDPHDPARRQPLPMAVRVEPARRAAAAALGAGDRSLVRLLARLGLAELPSATWLQLDPEGRTLLDIDVPGDLARLRPGAPDQRKR